MSDTTTTPHPSLKILSDKVLGAFEQNSIHLPEEVLSCVLHEGPYTVLFAPPMALWIKTHQSLKEQESYINRWLVEPMRTWVEGKSLGLTLMIEGDYTGRLHIDFVVLLD